MCCQSITSASSILDAVIQDEDLSMTLSQLVETKRGIITVASEALALLGMTPFIYIEICTVLEYGPKRWLSIWNLMDLATYFLQVCNMLLSCCTNHMTPHHQILASCNRREKKEKTTAVGVNLTRSTILGCPGM